MRSGRVLTGALLAALLLGCGPGRLDRGNRLYRDGRIDEAAAAYGEALRAGDDTPALHYNLGTAFLGLARYPESEQHLRRALDDLDPELQQRALYNLGNRFLLEGRATNPPQSLELLDAAVEAYKGALRIQPDDGDAKFNLELALREREEQAAGGGAGEDEGDPQDEQEGGEGDAPAPAQPRPEPGQAQRGPQLTPEQAERILGAAEQDERETYRDRLRRGRREVPVTRDW
jgi:Ca-activated chloride channel homolog